VSSNKINSNEKICNLKIFTLTSLMSFQGHLQKENAICIRVGGNIMTQEKLTEIEEESFVDRFYNDTPPVAQ